MYNPKLTYSDKLVLNLVKLENAKTVLQNMDIKSDYRYKLTQAAKTFDLFHLGHLLQLDMTLKDAEKIANGLNLSNIKDENAYKLKNFRETLEFSRSQISDNYAEGDLTTLVHIHKMYLNGWKHGDETRVRSGDLQDLEDSWSNFRDASVDPSKLEYELYELMDWYKNSVINVVPLIRIGILVYRLIELHPFAFANKVSILLYTDFLFYKNSFASKVFSSVFKIFNSNEQKLLEAYEGTRKNSDLSIWLEALVYAIYKDLMEVRENVGEFIKVSEKSKDQPFLDLNKRQLKILRYLQTIPAIQREDYCHMMEVSTMTAFRDLNDLVRKKLLKIEGVGRGTKYRLSSM